MRILVLGAGGQVGRAVVRTAPTGHEVLAKTRADVDIADASAVGRALAEAKPDWVVNAGAYTAVDLAEDEPAKAAAVNDMAVGLLAEAAGRAGSRLVHLSTDFVFDGSSSRAYLPSDAPNPLSVYGATKLGGERRVLGSDCAGIVLRTAWIYAATGRNFVLTMLRLMREREQVRVVSDQIGAPTWASGLARAVWGLIDADAAAGIQHWTDLGVASWYDFAVAIQEEALVRGLLKRAVAIVPIATAEYPTRARRPAFSVLDTSGTRALATTVPAVHWRSNLRAMLDELRAA
ncbi:MAG TPA: dTDP-4-dehydrorhamnose reductase [Steroidobacteraceae bacterium]